VTRKSITNQIRRLALRGCCRAPMRRQNLSKSVQQWRLNSYNEHRQANMKMIMTTNCYITFCITAEKCKPAVIPGFYPQLFLIEFLIVMASVALLIRLIIFCVLSSILFHIQPDEVTTGLEISLLNYNPFITSVVIIPQMTSPKVSRNEHYLTGVHGTAHLVSLLKRTSETTPETCSYTDCSTFARDYYLWRGKQA